MINAIAAKLRSAQSVVLSTHRQSDGDGLGSQVALFHALRKAGKSVRIVNVDPASRKYGFLGTNELIETYSSSTELGKPDLALVLDTNDRRLLEPLFSALQSTCREVVFIDHHPFLQQGPAPTANSWIDVGAASTGEMVFRLIKALDIPFDSKIARALYTSVVFDTQLFRYIKSDPASHLMAAELLEHEEAPEEVHRHLFATYSAEKMRLFGEALSRIRFFADGRAALILAFDSDQTGARLEGTELMDVIDLAMNIESLEMAALLRDLPEGRCKLSLRSKGRFSVLEIAESFGGGGHHFAAGATIHGDRHEIHDRLVQAIEQLIRTSGQELA